MTADVEDAAFIVDSRCWRPTFRLSCRCRNSFHCWQPMQKTYLSLLEVDVFSKVETSAYFVEWIHRNIYNMSQSISQKLIQHVSLHMLVSIVYTLLLHIQTLVFQQWSERRVKAELSFALLNLCPSNASYAQGETLKASFFISLPLTLISLVVPTEPCQVDILR
jgi:hypothetical protein